MTIGKFSDTLSPLIVEELSKFRGQQIEKLVAEALKKDGYNVRTTQDTRDKGVDVIASKRGITKIIQVKFKKQPISLSEAKKIIKNFEKWKKKEKKQKLGKVLYALKVSDEALKELRKNRVEVIEGKKFIKILSKSQVVKNIIKEKLKELGLEGKTRLKQYIRKYRGKILSLIDDCMIEKNIRALLFEKLDLRNFEILERIPIIHNVYYVVVRYGRRSNNDEFIILPNGEIKDPSYLDEHVKVYSKSDINIGKTIEEISEEDLEEAIERYGEEKHGYSEVKYQLLRRLKIPLITGCKYKIRGKLYSGEVIYDGLSQNKIEKKIKFKRDIKTISDILGISPKDIAKVFKPSEDNKFFVVFVREDEEEFYKVYMINGDGEIKEETYTINFNYFVKENYPDYNVKFAGYSKNLNLILKLTTNDNATTIFLEVDKNGHEISKDISESKGIFGFLKRHVVDRLTVERKYKGKVIYTMI